MTDEEFLTLIRATVKRLPKGHKRRNLPKRPTAGTRFRNAMYFLRYTGARPSEMSALTWDFVDFEHGVIVLEQHKTIKLMRTPRPRIIQMVPEIVNLLKRIKRQETFNDPHVFMNAYPAAHLIAHHRRGNPTAPASTPLETRLIHARPRPQSSLFRYLLRRTHTMSEDKDNGTGGLRWLSFLFYFFFLSVRR